MSTPHRLRLHDVVRLLERISLRLQKRVVDVLWNNKKAIPVVVEDATLIAVSP